MSDRSSVFQFDAEQGYRAVYETAPLAFVVWDRECRVMDWNHEAERTFGWSRDEAMGRNFFDLIIPGSARAQVKDVVDDLLMGRMPSHSENENLTKDGRMILCEWNNAVCRDAAGEIRAVISLGLDITKRRDAEDALKENEHFLANVFSSIQDGISVLDLDYKVLRVNPTMERWYAHALPLVGRKCYEVYHGRDKRCDICPTKLTLETSEPAYEVVPFTGPGGKIEGWLDLYSFPFMDVRTGKLVGVIEYVRDITDRKRAETALRESEAKYSALIKYAGDAILIVDERGKILESNRRAEALLGYSADELLGRNFINCHAESNRQKADGYLRLTTTFKNFTFYETNLATKENSTFPAEILLNAVEYMDKRVLKVVLRDVTERKKVEALRENVIRDITHKLKTPIATATMACDMAEEAMQREDSELRKKSLDMIVSSVKRLRMDVDRIMDSYKLLMKEPFEASRPASLRDVIESVMNEESSLAADKKLKLSVRVADGADVVGILEPDLYTLLGNLINNAIKFTRQGMVSVVAEPAGERVRITIEDTGSGIPADAIAHVFEEFYQANAALPGVGLGLAICRRIVDLYKGSIVVHSDGVGKGTKVIVELPR